MPTETTDDRANHSLSPKALYVEVAELRAKTDAPMMECKKALTEADGDMGRAEEILRVKLGNKAGKAAAPVGWDGS